MDDAGAGRVAGGFGAGATVGAGTRSMGSAVRPAVRDVRRARCCQWCQRFRPCRAQEQARAHARDHDDGGAAAGIAIRRAADASSCSARPAAALVARGFTTGTARLSAEAARCSLAWRRIKSGRSEPYRLAPDVVADALARVRFDLRARCLAIRSTSSRSLLRLFPRERRFHSASSAWSSSASGDFQLGAQCASKSRALMIAPQHAPGFTVVDATRRISGRSAAARRRVPPAAAARAD
jgi:hypothetical protein